MPAEETSSETYADKVRRFMSELSLDELRDVSMALRGPAAPSARSKSELIELILTTASVGEVDRCVQKVEALTPRKHLWLFAMGSGQPTPLDAEGLRTLATRLWPSGTVAFPELNVGSAVLQPSTWILDTASNSLYVKFTHWVETHLWKRISPTEKKLVVEHPRHVVTAVVRAAQGTLEVRFDGFAQSLSTPGDARLTYEQIAHEAAYKTADMLNIGITGIPLAGAVERLLDTLPSEVRDSRRSLRPMEGGGMSFESGEADGDPDIAAYVSQWLQRAGLAEAGQLKDLIRAAFRTTPSQSILLLWRNLDMLTRISFYQSTSELLFVWRSSSRSVASINRVLDHLLAAYRGLSATPPKEILLELRKLPSGTTTRVTDLMQLFAVNADEALRILEQARTDGLVRPVFRVNTAAALSDYVNAWRKSLTELPSEVVTLDGERMSLLVPGNIEVGFMREGAA